MTETTEQKDTMKELCIQQGYVPPTCQLPGMIVWHLIQAGESPCRGCNMDREKCGVRRNEGNTRTS